MIFDSKGIYSIPEEIGGLTNLTYLNMNSNFITSVPLSILNSNLKHIALSDNQIVDISPLCKPDLEYLDVSYNLIVQLPPQIVNMVSLYHLSLASNRLNNSFDDNLLKLTSLTYLSISDNYLGGEIYDKPFSNLMKLRHLDLSNNQFKYSLPYDLGPNLNYLHMDGNMLIGSIPNHYANFSNLSSLILRKNQFVGTIPSEFSTLKNLTILFK